MESTNKFQQGGVVRIKSGGEPMTVLSSDTYTTKVIYYNHKDGGVIQKELPTPCLIQFPGYGEKQED